MAKPPAVIVTENPFGDFPEEQMRGNQSIDRFYLAGYSDVRKERELAVRDGKRPAPLSHRFQYVSVQRPDGSANRNKEAEFRSRGYRPVQYDELGALGIDAVASTCERAADGTVRVASQLLMVADAAVAARDFQRQRDATQAQQDAVKSRLDEKAAIYNAKHGHTSATGTKFEIDE